MKCEVCGGELKSSECPIKDGMYCATPGCPLNHVIPSHDMNRIQRGLAMLNAEEAVAVVRGRFEYLASSGIVVESEFDMIPGFVVEWVASLVVASYNAQAGLAQRIDVNKPVYITRTTTSASTDWIYEITAHMGPDSSLPPFKTSFGVAKNVHDRAPTAYLRNVNTTVCKWMPIRYTTHCGFVATAKPPEGVCPACRRSAAIGE